jgi:4-hydroxyphenylpyruvate dioxygenase
MATATKPAAESAHDTFPINGTDYIEFWVGNAKQSMLFYRAAFGFQLKAYRGPETGVRDRASLPARAGQDPPPPHLADGARGRDGRAHRAARRRREGPRVLGRRCRDAYAKALERGAVSAREPRSARG